MWASNAGNVVNPDDNSLLENRCGLLDYRNELVDEDCTPKDKKPFICEQIKSMKCQTYRCGVIDVFLREFDVICGDLRAFDAIGSH